MEAEKQLVLEYLQQSVTNTMIPTEGPVTPLQQYYYITYVIDLQPKRTKAWNREKKSQRPPLQERNQEKSIPTSSRISHVQFA